MSENDLRVSLCQAGFDLWQRGLVGAGEGNLSLRLDHSHLLCTPAGVCKGRLSPESLVVIDMEGNLISGAPPSSEIKLHLGIYAHRSDCQAVVHAHPIVATGLALAGRSIPDDLLPEAAIILGRVALAPFAMPGTQEVPDSILPYLHDHKTILLSHHGAVTMGTTIEDATMRMEILERVAQMLLSATQFGGATPMPMAAYDQLVQSSLSGRLS